MATGELIHRPKCDKCVVIRMVIRRAKKLASMKGYKSPKFFNRKKQDMVLEDIDLLMDLDDVRDEDMAFTVADAPSVAVNR